MMPYHIGVVILAAGKGTRLGCTDIPKVMLSIGGKPIVAHTVETLETLGFLPDHIRLVVGFQKEKIVTFFGERVRYAVQEKQLGTAHAAYVGMRALPPYVTTVLVMGGDDSAFYTPEGLRTFVDAHHERNVTLSLLSAVVDNPEQLGRVVRHDNGHVDIIEKEFLTEEQKKITEISTGTFCLDRVWYEEQFPRMPRMERLGEYGLPMALAMVRDQNRAYQVVSLEESAEWFGVNTPQELAEADRRKTLAT